MTDKSIFKVVVLSFFITFTLIATGLFIAAFRRIPVVGSGGSTAFSVAVSKGFIRLILIAMAIGVVVITYLVVSRRKLK